MRYLVITAITALLTLAGCDKKMPQNVEPTPKPNYGPTAWSTSKFIDDFTDKNYHSATAYTTADSPMSAILKYIDHPNYPPQIHPRTWTHYCGNIDSSIGIQVLLDGEKPNRFKTPTARVHAANETIFIQNLTKEMLDPVKELRVKLNDSICGQVFIYYFDVSGAVPRP